MRPPVVLCALAAACILVYFFSFTGPGLEADFTPDDLMNMYQAWRWGVSDHLTDIVLFFRFSETFRPFGSLFYWLLFQGFGMEDAFVFRVVCHLLMLANLWLGYALARRLSGSREVALLAVLLFAYHGEARSLYVNTGMCYDLLCLFFYAAAFVYYLKAREGGRALGARQLAVWSVLYVLCLNSKEMAVTLPVMIGVYELVANPPEVWRRASLANWALWEGRVPIAGGILTALFLAGRIAGARGLPSMDAYRPEFSLYVYLDGVLGYLRLLFYRSEWLTPGVFTGLALLMTVIAIRWRSVPFRFGFLWLWIGILPVALIPLRGLDAIYVPALGLALALAAALVELSRRMSHHGQQRAVTLFASVLLVLVYVHREFGSIDFQTITADSRHIRDVYRQLCRARPEIPAGSEILFVKDPFPRREWNSAFLVGLYTQDRSVQVNRLDRIVRDWKPGDTVYQNVVFTYENGRLELCDPAPFQGVLVRELSGRRCREITNSERNRPTTHTPQRRRRAPGAPDGADRTEACRGRE